MVEFSWGEKLGWIFCLDDEHIVTNYLKMLFLLCPRNSNNFDFFLFFSFFFIIHLNIWRTFLFWLSLCFVFERMHLITSSTICIPYSWWSLVMGCNYWQWDTGKINYFFGIQKTWNTSLCNYTQSLWSCWAPTQSSLSKEINLKSLKPKSPQVSKSEISPLIQ